MEARARPTSLIILNISSRHPAPRLEQPPEKMAAVARNYPQDDVHPLLRHPRPIKRDPAKAHRMLDFIAGSEEALNSLQREKSVTTRWLERPMYEQQQTSQVAEQSSQPTEEPVPEAVQVQEPSKQEPALHVVDVPRETPTDDSDSDLLDKWTNPDRPTSTLKADTSLRVLPDLEPMSKLNTCFVKQRPQPLTRPVSYNSQHLLTPEWTASPTTFSPETSGSRYISSSLDSMEKPRSSISSRDSYECEQVHPALRNRQPMQETKDTQTGRPISYHPQSFTSLDSPPLKQRPRPTSFANYHQRVRSGTKIASSRGLRNNSYPANSSRPVSGIIPKTVAGENIENDTSYQCFGDDEVGPPTPMKSTTSTLPSPLAFSATPAIPVRSPFDSFDNLEQKPKEEKPKPEKKNKNRWSTIPQAFKNFGARRRDSTAAQQEQPKFATVVDDIRRMKLTEENLHTYDSESTRASVLSKRQSAFDLAPTPAYSPLNASTTPASPHLVPLPAPFAPWTTNAPPSPAMTTADRRRSSAASLSPKQKPLGLAVDIPHQTRPSSMHSYSSRPPTTATTSTADVPRIGTPASRRNTPAIERTCILCKTVKSNAEFVTRRITKNCWHEPATCVECLQGWVMECARGARGIEGCTCPECGEGMAGEDVFAFTGIATP